MLKRWRSNFLSKEEFRSLENLLKGFVNNKPFLVLTPDNTGANWLGVKNATFAMYPENTFVFPQSYSQPRLSPTQLTEFSNIVTRSNIRLVIFSGTPAYVLSWIEQFHNSKIECGLILHGGLAEMSYSKDNRQNMKKVIELGSKGIISRVGVVKDGLDSWFKNFSNCNVYRVLPAMELPNGINPNNFNDGKVHLGVFGNSSYNKNRHTQVAAAALVKNSIVHVLEPNEFDYGIPDNRIVTHSNLNRNDFLALLGSMDLNLYCSFSESWGQVVIESLALNVPCIYSNNSGISDIIDSTKYLVNEYDNIVSISKKIETILIDNNVDFNLNSFQKRVNELNNELIKI